MARLDWEAARRRDLERQQPEPLPPPDLPPARHPASMTPPQARYLRALCARHGLPFDPSMGRRDAARLIDKLKQPQ